LIPVYILFHPPTLSLIAVAADHNDCVAAAILLALSLKTGTWAYM